MDHLLATKQLFKVRFSSDVMRVLIWKEVKQECALRIKTGVGRKCHAYVSKWGGPGLRQSLRDGCFSFSLAEASYLIRSFVLSAFALVASKIILQFTTENEFKYIVDHRLASLWLNCTGALKMSLFVDQHIIIIVSFVSSLAKVTANQQNSNWRCVRFYNTTQYNSTRIKKNTEEQVP